MRCKQVEQLIELYADGAAGERERTAVEQHVAGCDGCARALQQSRALRAALGAMPSRNVSAAFEQRLMAAVAEEAPTPAAGASAWLERLRLRFEWRLRVPALVTAGSLAAALIVGLLAPGQLSQVTSQEAQRQEFVYSAVNRHEELKVSSEVDWEAVDSSIELSTGDLLPDARITP